jgi:gamma-glutamyltranspeptidase/glutathione hydrolase
MSMVATSQRLATDVGLAILKAGGNAADAAIACAAALNVTEPCSTGIGGDCFALYWDGREVAALNGSGRAPAALTLDIVGSRLDPFSPHTVTVPGACAGWFDLLERHGSMKMADVLAPAIRLAEDGFPVAPITAHFWARGLPQLKGQELTIDGRAPRASETFRNSGLARTFRAISTGGRDAFYRGPISKAIVETVRSAGGLLAESDFAHHQSTWEPPISTTFRGHSIWECPPNGQGIAALIALNLFETFPRTEGVDRWHLLIESMRLAFADARAHVADGAHLEWALDKGYAARRARLIDPKRATVHAKPGSSSDTVYFCVVDDGGHACSFINSNYMGFGTGLVPAGWGFTLQNRGHNFSLDPAHPNALAPFKRPYHTIMPGMITRGDGSLYGPFGVMGGFMQPQGHLQVAVSLLEDGLDPQAALDRPRFCIGPDGRVHLEEGFDPAIVDGLRERGHDVVANIGGFERPPRSRQGRDLRGPAAAPAGAEAGALFGRGQVIVRTEGRLEGGSDRRADGSVGRTA